MIFQKEKKVFILRMCSQTNKFQKEAHKQEIVETQVKKNKTKLQCTNGWAGPRNTRRQRSLHDKFTSKRINQQQSRIFR